MKVTVSSSNIESILRLLRAMDGVASQDNTRGCLLGVYLKDHLLMATDGLVIAIVRLTDDEVQDVNTIVEDRGYGFREASKGSVYPTGEQLIMSTKKFRTYSPTPKTYPDLFHAIDVSVLKPVDRAIGFPLFDAALLVRLIKVLRAVHRGALWLPSFISTSKGFPTLCAMVKSDLFLGCMSLDTRMTPMEKSLADLFSELKSKDS